MGKPSASPTISKTAIVAMAELATPTDFATYRNKTISNTKERLQFEQDYMVFHVQQHFAGNNDVLEMFDTIFKQMKRAAAREYPTPMDVVSSAPSSKRPMRDFDDEEEPLSRRQKGETSAHAAPKSPKSPKPGKAGKAAKDNAEPRENKPRGQNGMNWFVKEMGGEVEKLGHVGKNKFNESIYLWSLYEGSEKEKWQLKVGPVNLHHIKLRPTVEADPDVKADQTNKRLNKLWNDLDAAGKQVYVKEFEDLPMNRLKNIKVPADEDMPDLPKDIRDVNGNIEKKIHELNDGTKIDFHETLEGKDKQGNVFHYTVAQRAKERFDLAKAYLEKQSPAERLDDDEEDADVTADAAALQAKAKEAEETAAAEQAAAKVDEAEETVAAVEETAAAEEVAAETSEAAAEAAAEAAEEAAADAIVDDTIGDDAAADAVNQALSTGGSAPGSPAPSAPASAPDLTTPPPAPTPKSPPAKPGRGGARRRAL